MNTAITKAKQDAVFSALPRQKALGNAAGGFFTKKWADYLLLFYAAPHELVKIKGTAVKAAAPGTGSDADPDKTITTTAACGTCAIDPRHQQPRLFRSLARFDPK